MTRISFLMVVATLLVLSGCGSSDGNRGDSNRGDRVQPQATASGPDINEEAGLLLSELKESGDYVNSQYFPSLIKASVVSDELDENNLVIDLRSPQLYAAGHIRGAVSQPFTTLPDYFESAIRPYEYDKIIIVDEEGQLAGYATSLLRLMGYGNVYAMRWGMGGWNSSYAREGWMKGLSSDYVGRLESDDNEPPAAGQMPLPGTGLKSGSEVADARIRELFRQGDENVLITAEKVFAEPANYFVINLERKDKYESGHIPGAVRYKPEATLGYPAVMATIPTDKTVVVYCGTGHNSAFATAYLRLFGYDARTLRYGNNSFMYDKMVNERSTLSWLPFTLDESNDFPVVKR